MIDLILTFFATFSPIIITGVFVMIILKTNVLKNLTTTIDFGHNFIDKKRIFGSSKTWRGLLFYMFFGAVSGFVWFFICSIFSVIHDYNLFLTHNNNSFVYMTLVGMLLGTAYAVFELPNSFLKRRLSVSPSESATNFLPKTIHFIIDQIDSIIGCLFVLWVFYPELSSVQAFSFLIIGAITHIIINLLLYSLKIRKRPV